MTMTFKEFLLIEADPKAPANKDKDMAIKKELENDTELRHSSDSTKRKKRTFQSMDRFVKRLNPVGKDYPNDK